MTFWLTFWDRSAASADVMGPMRSSGAAPADPAVSATAPPATRADAAATEKMVLFRLPRIRMRASPFHQAIYRQRATVTGLDRIKQVQIRHNSINPYIMVK